MNLLLFLNLIIFVDGFAFFKKLSFSAKYEKSGNHLLFQGASDIVEISKIQVYFNHSSSILTPSTQKRNFIFLNDRHNQRSSQNSVLMVLRGAEVLKILKIPRI